MWFLLLVSAFLSLSFTYGYPLNRICTNYHRSHLGGAINKLPVPVRFRSTGGNEAAVVSTESSSHYCQCSQCKTAYEVSETDFGINGKLVKCSVCDKVWFQSQQRLLKKGSTTSLVDVPHEKLQALRSAKTWETSAVKLPKPRKIEAFIGNLPPHFEEKDLLELFAEYGVLALSVARDSEGQNKGFAFIQVRATFLQGFKLGLYQYMNWLIELVCHQRG